MTSEGRHRKVKEAESYEETIAGAKKLTEEERMELARKVLLAAVPSARRKK